MVETSMLTGIFSGGNYAGWLGAFLTFVYVIILAGIGWIGYWLLFKYPYLVIIRAKRNLGVTVFVDRGRLVTDKTTGAQNLVLFQHKGVKLPKPDGTYVAPKRGLTTRMVVEYYQDSQGEYNPIDMRVNSPPALNVNIIPWTQQKEWYAMIQEKVKARYQANAGFWNKYGIVFLNIGIVMMSFILMLYMIQTQKEVIGGWVSEMGKYTATLEKITSALVGGK